MLGNSCSHNLGDLSKMEEEEEMMESWFEPLFRIPFTIYWVSRDLRTEKGKYLLSRKMFDSSIGKYYWEAV